MRGRDDFTIRGLPTSPNLRWWGYGSVTILENVFPRRLDLQHL